jgi:predicted transcriptional regulator
MKLPTHNYRPLTAKELNYKKFRRLHDKSLEQVLLHRFLNHYGYDKGEVTARAIIDDLLHLIERHFLITRPHEDAVLLKYGQMAWPAVPIEERPKRGQRIQNIPMKLVVLTFLSDEDIASIQDGFRSRELRMRRMVRWIDEAFDQGALLNQLDLAMLLNVCDQVVSDYVNEYQRTTGRVLPTRGNIHDLSGAITHKREIVSLYLQGLDTPRIARKTNHAKESVDRYIRDFETVRMLTALSTDPHRIAQLARLSHRVVSQYLDLLPLDPRTNGNKPPDGSNSPSTTEPGKPNHTEATGATNRGRRNV